MAEDKNKEEKNVKCSFCGDDAFCNICKAGPEKISGFEHMCYECYQRMGGQVPENIKGRTHICVLPDKLQEDFERFMNEVTQQAFMELWNAEKKNLKSMSRQELAQSVFFEGARFMFHFMRHISASRSRQPEVGTAEQKKSAGRLSPEQ